MIAADLDVLHRGAEKALKGRATVAALGVPVVVTHRDDELGALRDHRVKHSLCRFKFLSLAVLGNVARNGYGVKSSVAAVELGVSKVRGNALVDSLRALSVSAVNRGYMNVARGDESYHGNKSVVLPRIDNGIFYGILIGIIGGIVGVIRRIVGIIGGIIWVISRIVGIVGGIIWVIRRIVGIVHRSIGRLFGRLLGWLLGGIFLKARSGLRIGRFQGVARVSLLFTIRYAGAKSQRKDTKN